MVEFYQIVNFVQPQKCRQWRPKPSRGKPWRISSPNQGPSQTSSSSLKEVIGSCSLNPIDLIWSLTALCAESILCNTPGALSLPPVGYHPWCCSLPLTLLVIDLGPLRNKLCKQLLVSGVDSRRAGWVGMGVS